MFSAISKASQYEPQGITSHSKLAAIVISPLEYQKLKKPKESLVKFLQNSPLYGINIDLEKDKTTERLNEVDWDYIIQ